MKHLHVISTLILLLLPLTPISVVSQEAEVNDEAGTAWKLYSSALEALLEGNEEEAVELFERVRSRYPGTEPARKAGEHISNLSQTLDHSGVVPFYLGNILTGLIVIEGIPALFEVDDPLVYGSLGIAGLGTGIGSAWLMSKDQDVSFARDVWIEFSQISAMANYQLLVEAVRPYLGTDARTEEKITIGGQMSVALGTRTAAYLTTRGKRLSPGRASLTASSYAWAHLYYWLSMTGIVRSEDPTLNSALGLVLPDAAAIASYFAWDHFRMSANRVGFLSVGAVGGGLIGTFVNVILSGIDEHIDQRIQQSVLVGSILTGQGAAWYFTRTMPQERTSASRIAGSGTGRTSRGSSSIGIAPFISPSGWGFALSLSY